MKKGRIIPNGTILEKHEYETVTFLTDLGFDIELIPRSKARGIHTPDLKIGREEWEMKAPTRKMSPGIGARIRKI